MCLELKGDQAFWFKLTERDGIYTHIQQSVDLLGIGFGITTASLLVLVFISLYTGFSLKIGGARGCLPPPRKR